MKKELSLFLRLIFSISIILILFYKIGPKDIIQTFVKVNLLYTPLIILAIIFTVLLGALNLKILIDCINKIKFLKTEELKDLIIKFIRMSEKKDQKKTIDEIKYLLKSIGVEGF